MAAPKNQFHITGTPDPNEEAFFTDLNQEALKNLRNDQWPRTSDGGNTATLYQDWVLSLPERVKQGWGNYVYVRKRPLGDGVIRFFWAKNKTEEEKNTPYRETPSFGNHYWPPMLLLLRFIPDRNFPITTQGANGQMIVGYRHYVREVFIPGANEGSLFITREFFAAEKFDIGQHPVPEPTAVSYDYLGARGSFPECLHDRIRIPAMRTAFASYTTGGGSAGASGVLAGQIFPATNFTEWAPYIVSDKQVETEEGWKREQVEVFPPPIPDTIIR